MGSSFPEAERTRGTMCLLLVFRYNTASAVRNL